MGFVPLTGSTVGTTARQPLKAVGVMATVMRSGDSTAE